MRQQRRGVLLLALLVVLLVGPYIPVVRRPSKPPLLHGVTVLCRWVRVVRVS